MGDAAYYVSYVDLKPELIKETDQVILDESRDGGVSNSGGKLLSEKKIALDGYPGREIAIALHAEQHPPTKARARFYLVENRLYTVIFAGTETAADSPKTEAYLASLRLQEPKALPQSWTQVDSPEGRFTIKMPGAPVSSVVQTEMEETLHRWQFLSEKKDIAYFVAYSDVSPIPQSSEDIEKTLDHGRDAVARSMSATLEDESLLSVDGNYGREVHMRMGATDGDGGIITFRGLMVKGRYYQVMALGNRAAILQGRVDDFMNSFRLIIETPPSK
jgi:hypothetical protein